ncbi:hypothetical protein Cni_G07860 [Canna indica]|uniref:Uncharacterized protein n=1 Tax=Canna indica TaxID=4628 RepID=A0AAQ3K122_9LILI|nr:hypothetical protein Cni_G07860 [Canna indica]
MTLSDLELSNLKDLKGKLDGIYKEEDLFWRQRAKHRWIKNEDLNTQYFHQWATLRRKLNWVHHLNSDFGEVTNINKMTDMFRSYYIRLLGRRRSPLSWWMDIYALIG